MIVIPIKDGENIERALKRYKKKFERTGVVKELRSRKQFLKPSVVNRAAMIKAVYIEKLRKAEE
ncbi:30S ribosomal protein S21 [Vicingus serpentipes]|jgi:small subunit ribosomal protein S21|uniref:Small ribosomal subunit protein bS21 n=1 Tax=Vicingus serpentipes TaxID=1926625 RepID=A0A5C6RTG4_9FLAO|nr:30S ribosomal protein S21 [Vicingus serpentipes]MCB9361514.1 30S ribosomal protein S21 [Flavobacteriales bacterium]MCB9362958.1 30S ribosomal protein S21 [Flavobacteriales bacterium]TXB65225.1 30S ribosomal protein S21 [Vicingus serpentipes]|tara:strand:+ start:7876 stop:8067 length:192 start_codon:yes stop_codon:yes gene_type:complete